jgi:hypothetical protein
VATLVNEDVPSGIKRRVVSLSASIIRVMDLMKIHCTISHKALIFILAAVST